MKCLSKYKWVKGIYISHILEAITIAGNKAGDGFDLNRLLFDVQRLLK